MLYNELYDDPVVSIVVPGTNIQVNLFEYPTDKDWFQVKRRALITVHKSKFELPDSKWKAAMFRCRHSPIRRLNFSFLIEQIPYCNHVHLVRHHVGCTPYVGSQRNDRQSEYDREAAPQNAPVDMIYDFNADSLLTFFNKRLCHKADIKTRAIVEAMAICVKKVCPEMSDYIQPMCKYHGGICHEFRPCGDKIE